MKQYRFQREVPDECDECSFIYKLGLNDNIWHRRVSALEDLPDECETYLSNCMLREDDDFVLFCEYIKLKSINSKSPLFLNPCYVYEIESEEMLMEIIKNSIYSSPKISKGVEVNNCKVYPYLVNADDRWLVRWAAVKNPNFKDEETLKDIALNDYDIRVRCEAINNPNLNDDDLMNYLAQYDCKSYVRMHAVKYVKDEKILKKIFKYNSVSSIRCNAISNSNFRDEDFLTDLAMNDKDYNVRYNAVLKIKDEDFLIDVIKNDYHSKVCDAAFSLIHSADAFKKIVDGKFKGKYRSQAKEKLSQLK